MNKIRESDKKYRLRCASCGSTENLCMMAHRDEKERVVGFIYSCISCYPTLADCDVEIKKSIVKKSECAT